MLKNQSSLYYMQTAQEQKNGIADKSTSDEIDLRSLFLFLGKMLERGWEGLISLIIGLKRITIKNRFLLVVIFILAVASGAVYKYYFHPPEHQTTLIFRSRYLNAPLLDKYIEKLNANSIARGRLLGLDSLINSSIIRFEAEPFISEEEIIEFELFKQELLGKLAQTEVEKVIDKLTLENRATYQVHVVMTVEDYEPLVDIQDSLLRYLSENSYVKKRIEIDEKNLQNRKQKIREEMKNLDSLRIVLLSNIKSLTEVNREGSNNVILGENQQPDPIRVYLEDLRLYDEEQLIDRRLYLRDSFELLDGFGTFKSANAITLLRITIYAGFGALIFAYVIILLTEFNQYLVRKEIEKSSGTTLT